MRVLKQEARCRAIFARGQCSDAIALAVLGEACVLIMYVCVCMMVQLGLLCASLAAIQQKIVCLHS
jgi:hypothetical protein